MNKVLSFIRSNALAQAILCLVLGLFLLMYPSMTIAGMVRLFALAFVLLAAASFFTFFREKDASKRNTATITAAVFYTVIALVAFLFPRIVASIFAVALGLILLLCALVNITRALGLKKYGSSIWIAVLALALLVAAGGVLIVVNPFGATVTFVLIIGAVLVINGFCDLFIEWYLRDRNTQRRRS